VLRHERAGKISPSCRLYEPEAESKSWAGEKTPVKMGGILYSPEINAVLTGSQSGSPQTSSKNEKGFKRISEKGFKRISQLPLLSSQGSSLDL